MSNGGYDIVRCYNAYNYRFKHIDTITTRKKSYPEIYTLPVVLDIETSTFPGVRDDKDNWIKKPYGIMYHWQICIAGDIVLGRNFSDLKCFFDRLIGFYDINENRKMIIYCHNLSFEWQFIQRIFTGWDVFAIKPHGALCARIGCGLEFRCSWRLSNMSLDGFLKSQKAAEKYAKAIGDLDYSVWRDSSTKLSVKETMYCISDVLPLYHALIGKMEEEGDTLASIPMTSTGYVRRYVRSRVLESQEYRKLLQDTKITPTVYRLLKLSGAGGDTHANRYAADQLWEECDGFDAQSSYPYVLLTKKYPISKFRPYGQIASRAEFNDLLDKYACLFRVQLTNVNIKPGCIDPVLQSYKCQKIRRDPENKIFNVYDNGRILHAYEIETCMNDIDWKEFIKYYTFDQIKVAEMYIANYGYLPKILRDSIFHYYANKCHIKFLMGKIKDKKSQEYIDLKYFYDKSKNLLNGIFGMMYTDPLRDEIIENLDYSWDVSKIDINDTGRIKSSLDDYYSKKFSLFLNYAWGSWTTSHARAHLHRLIDAGASPEGVCCYWDTDSLKGYKLNIANIIRENDLIMKEDIELGAYYDEEGERFYLGVYEQEDHMKYFKTLGAKKYAYVTDDGKLHLTISGVNKNKGAEELGSIDNFRKGFVFRHAASKKIFYQNNDDLMINNGGNEESISPSVAVLDNTYTLGLTRDYEQLLEDILCNG